MLYSAVVYVAFFLAAIVFSFVVNGLLLRFSKTLGTRSNNENLIRWSSQTKPSFGGISFFIIFLLSIGGFTFFFSSTEFFHNIRYLGIFLATALAFLMGLFDDAYNTRVSIKLVSQITCGVILVATGTYIHLFEIPALDYLLTVLWVVGMMNSINMLDNMDGITTMVSLFIFLAVLVNNSICGLVIASPLNFVLIGVISALLGFLYFNWHPAKMYMGDTGSQFLGLLLAVTGIVYFWNFTEPDGKEIVSKQIILVAVTFVLPLTDTTTVFFKRIKAGRSPFVGGKDHTTHHLSYAGLKDRGVAVSFSLIAAIAAALSVLAMNISEWKHIYTAFFALFFVAVFVILFIIANRNIEKSIR